MSFTNTQILLGFILPAGLTLIAFLVAWLMGKRWIAPPALFAAYIIAFFPMRSLDPRDFHVWHGNIESWLLYLAVPLAALLTLDAIFRPPWWIRAAALIGFWWLACRPLLAPLIPNTITDTQAQWWMVAAALISLAWWATFESIAVRSPGPLAPMLLMILSGAAAIMLLTLWGSQKSAAQAASLAAVCGAVLIISILAAIFRKPLPLDRGLAVAVPTLLVLLLLHAHLYTGDNDMRYLLRAGPLLAAPLLTFTADLPGIRRRRWLRLMMRVLPFVIAVAAVSALCTHELIQSQESPASSDEI